MEETMGAFSKKILVGSVMAAAIVAGSAGVLVAQDKPVIATVVKISGIPWFDRLNTGVVAFQKANPDVVATQYGPATADAAQQLQIIQDLTAKGVNALAVVPMDPAVIEGALKRAMDRGIVVVTHEADNQKNTQADVEAFDNAEYGKALNEAACAVHGRQGQVDHLRRLARRPHAPAVGRRRRGRTPRATRACSSSTRTTSRSTTPAPPMRRPRKSCASTRISRASRPLPATTCSVSAAPSTRRASPARSAWSAPACRTPRRTCSNPARSPPSASGIRRRRPWR